MPVDTPDSEYRPWPRRRHWLSLRAFDQSAGQVGLAIALIAFACVVAVALIVGSQLLLGNYDLRTPFSS